MRVSLPLLKSVNKISIIGAGAIGRQTLFSILRTFPPTKNLEIVLFNRTYEKALGYSDDLTIGGLDTDYLDKWHNNSKSNDISIIPTSNEADIADSKVVIFTAGISAALSISKGSIAIDDRCKLSDEEIKKLHIISNNHQELIEEIKDVPTHLVDKIEGVINNLMIRTEELKKFFRVNPPKNNPSYLSFQKLQESSLEHEK